MISSRCFSCRFWSNNGCLEGKPEFETKEAENCRSYSSIASRNETNKKPRVKFYEDKKLLFLFNL